MPNYWIAIGYLASVIGIGMFFVQLYKWTKGDTKNVNRVNITFNFYF